MLIGPRAPSTRKVKPQTSILQDLRWPRGWSRFPTISPSRSKASNATTLQNPPPYIPRTTEHTNATGTRGEPGEILPTGTQSGALHDTPLPGGRVPRVHGARSPVPPRPPYFATPRSERHLGTVVAGAYPLRRPSDAWSPGLLAPPGPCYWLVASGTPMGWRGGCLAAGLVGSTVCYYYLDAVPWSCVRGARSKSWGSEPVPVLAPPFPPVTCGVCCGLSGPGVPSLRLPVRHSMRSVRSAASDRLPFGSVPPVRWVWVRSCSRGVRASPSPQCTCGACNTRSFGAGRRQGPSRRFVPLPVSFPGPVIRLFCSGGLAQSLRPLAWLAAARPPAGGRALVNWLCALRGGQEGARGGAPLAWVWGVRGWALSHT